LKKIQTKKSFDFFILGKTSVMHLVQREHLPESTNGDQKRKHKHDNNQEGTADVIRSTSETNPTPGCCEACSIL